MNKYRQKLSIKMGIAAITIAAITTGYAITPLTAQANYNEECLSEGCSTEEVQELWNGFYSECFDEGCWKEEVRELAGGGNDKILQMFNAFGSIGHSVQMFDDDYLGDETNEWQAFACWASFTKPNSGNECRTVTVKSPKIKY